MDINEIEKGKGEYMEEKDKEPTHIIQIISKDNKIYGLDAHSHIWKLSEAYWFEGKRFSAHWQRVI